MGGDCQYSHPQEGRADCVSCCTEMATFQHKLIREATRGARLQLVWAEGHLKDTVPLLYVWTPCCTGWGVGEEGL